ncbi:hypothetical protein CFC21_010433 [Triticum aestivum]|nr:hypothetical protein CFC21_010433 [Triticum aestivum]
MIKGKSASETEQSAVRVLQALFPPLLLVLFKALLAPIANGQLASMMVARATALSCQWLMGTCSVNSVTLPNGKSLSSGVFVEKCKYLEESKCLGICINTCKLPTQTFFKDHMGVDLYMEPNFEDYSCQVKEIQGSFQLWSATPTYRHGQGLEGTLLGHMHKCETAQRAWQQRWPRWSMPPSLICCF